MRRIAIDNSIQRVEMEGYTFPLGVYPVEPMEPVSGYVMEFEPADGPAPITGLEGDEDWEEWPDRFMYDVALPASRLRPFVLSLLSFFPLRVYPILDVLGRDAFRDIDPYIAYDPVGLEKVYEAFSAFGDWLCEDGMIGFGAMSIEPFLYLFIDEHKIVTVRAELDLKERVEKVLSAFDLVEVPKIAGADSAEHEHRSVLVAPEDRPELIAADEIIDALRSMWRLQLNVDPTTNLDSQGAALGITHWQCLARCIVSEDDPERYAEVLLTADSLESAEQIVSIAIGEAAPDPGGWLEFEVLRADRLLPEQFTEMNDGKPVAATENRVVAVRWME